MKKVILTILLGISLVGCSSGVSKKNKWQKNEDFIARRSIYYNDFVQSGGMVKDENTDQTNQVKKEIQNSFNQGKLMSSSQ